MIRRLTLPDSAALGTGTDARRSAPSAERNLSPILDVLARIAPARGRALELASGTGQHVAAFAAALPGLDWQPSDGNTEALASIRAWVAASGLPNLAPPVVLDAGRPGWDRDHSGQDFVFVSNLLHLISATEAEAAVTGMVRALAPGGRAAIYGPFRRDGQLTSPGDEAFDARLRAQDPAIGYKCVTDVTLWAGAAGGRVAETVEMPANNLVLLLAPA